MTTSINICNRALVKLGANTIMAMDGNEKEAKVMRILYMDTLFTELALYRWKFAIKREALPKLDAGAKFGFTYAYMLPSMCLSVIEIGEHVVVITKSEKWAIEGKHILTNMEAPLYIRYIDGDTNVENFSQPFKDAFVCKLAFNACEALTQSNSKKDAAWQEYEEAIDKARQADAIEKIPDVIGEGSWLRARNG